MTLTQSLIYFVKFNFFYHSGNFPLVLLPTGSKEREVLRRGGWEHSCCNTSLLSIYETYCIIIAFINMNIVG